jgi:hypothetical protein
MPSIGECPTDGSCAEIGLQEPKDPEGSDKRHWVPHRSWAYNPHTSNPLGSTPVAR